MLLPPKRTRLTRSPLSCQLASATVAALASFFGAPPILVFLLAIAVGILIASVVGGYLFDHWLKTGPFVFFGAISALVLVWTLVLRMGSTASTTAPEAG